MRALLKAIPRPASALVHGVDGDGRPQACVMVYGRVAAYLERYAELDRFRREHRGEDAEVDQALMALHQVALSWRGSATGTRDAAPAEPPAASSQWLTCTQAAGILGIGDRAVRKAIQQHQLRATSVDGRWQISIEDLAHYRALRPQRR